MDEPIPVPQADLIKLNSDLQGLGLPAWTHAQVTARLSIADFRKELGVFMKLEHQTRIDAVAHRIALPAACTVSDMVSFCNWLGDTEEGKFFLNKCKRTRNLEKKIVGGQSLIETAWVFAFKEQQNEIKIKTKECRSGPLQLDGSGRLREYKEGLKPAADYTGPPNTAEVNRRCRLLNEPSGEPYDMERCKARYGEEAKRDHILDFLNEIRRGLLREWMRKHVESKGQLGNSKELQDLCSYAEAIGVDLTVPLIDVLSNTPQSRKRSRS